MEKISLHPNLTDLEFNIGKEIFKLNLIISYPYSDELIGGMAKTLIRLLPDVTSKELSELIDDYFLGKRIFKKENSVSILINDLKTKRLLKASHDNHF
jgi:hypothetical protein